MTHEEYRGDWGLSGPDAPPDWEPPVGCTRCDAPSIVAVGDGAYCAEHDPRQVQLAMPVAQAARLVAWLEGPRASGNDDAEAMRAALARALARL